MLINNPVITGSFTVNGTNFITNTPSTGSNTFNGNQIISGSAIVTGSLQVTGSVTTTGTITAQTLVVQTVTSSVVYSSGSNVFGNSSSNTQVMTGSLLVTGSLNTFAGSVGIGTSSPSTLLHIGSGGGAGATNSIAYLGGYSTGVSQLRYIMNHNGAANVGIGTPSNGGILFGYGAVDGTVAGEWMRITTSGNVGIGTSNPTGSLDVRGLASFGDVKAYNSIQLVQSYNNPTVQSWIWTANDGQLNLGTGSVGAGNTIMTLTNGRVGIGTNNPSSTRADRVLSLYGAYPGLTLESTGVPRKWDITANYANGSAFLEFYDETAAAARMVINPSGSIGIGTTTPTSPFLLEISTTDNTTWTTTSRATNWLRVSNQSSTNNTYSGIEFLANGAGNSGVGGIVGQVVGGGSMDLVFYSRGSSTFSEKARILSSGGLTFNGDTSTANALDDYEEGTFTPTVNLLGTVTYNSRIGLYTKIGNVVNYTIFLVLSCTNSTQDSTSYQISGLPFTSSNVSSLNPFAMACTEQIYKTSSLVGTYFQVSNNNTAGTLIQNSWNNELVNKTYYSSVLRSGYSGGTQYINISGFYYTA